MFNMQDNNAQDTRRGIIIVGEYYYKRPLSAGAAQIAEVAESRDDIDVFFGGDVAFCVQDNELVCVFPDGTTLSRNTPENEKPRWVMNRCNAYRLQYMMELLGIPCFPNSKAILIAEDKSLGQALMTGILPSLDCVVKGTRGMTDKFVSEVVGGHPYVMKSAQGCGGTDVHMIREPDDFERVILECEYDNKNKIFCQQACKTGDDLRIYIIEGEIIACVLRAVRDGHWKANLKFEPDYSLVEVDDDMRKAVETAAALMGERHGLISIDMLFDDDKPVLCELNSNPGFGALREVGLAEGFLERYIDVLDELIDE